MDDHPPPTNTPDKLYVARKRHAAHYASVLRSANELYLKGGGVINEALAMLDLEWPNILTGQAWAAAGTESDDAAAELCSVYADGAVNLFLLRQQSHDLVRWLEAALAAARRLKKRPYE